MKENIKVGEKWVYVKCSVCGRKKDFSKEAFEKKCGELTPEEFAKLFICKSCQKQKPVEKQDGDEKTEQSIKSKPYSKEKQLGKKEKKTVLTKEDDEDFFAK